MSEPSSLQAYEMGHQVGAKRMFDAIERELKLLMRDVRAGSEEERGTPLAKLREKRETLMREVRAEMER